MADTRYLKRRREGWYFQMAVPRAVRDAYGSAVISSTLNTRDLTVAQHRRWAKLIEAQDALRRAAGADMGSPTGGPASPVLTQIDGHAQSAYRAALAVMEFEAECGKRAFAAPPEDEATNPASPEISGLWLVAADLTDAIEQDDFQSVAATLGPLSQSSAFEPGSDAYRMLGQSLLKAQLAAVEGRMAALAGEPTEHPPSFVPSGYVDPVSLKPARGPKRKPSDGLTFSEAAANFIEEMQRDPAAKMTAQTQGQHEAAFRLFTDFVSDAPLLDIDRATASAFVSSIARLHPHWGRSAKSKELSLAQLLEKYGQGDEQLSNKTLNRIIGSLSGVFKHARKRGHFDGNNPFAEQSRPKARKGSTEWLPFTDAELNKLFGSDLFRCETKERLKPKAHTIETALRWVPLIGLFSGMRLGEICSLGTDDIRCEDGIHFFNVCEDAEEGKRVKTAAAVRRIPVHSELVKCGLLKYVKALPEGQLFPALTPGGPDDKLSWVPTQHFTRLRRALGLTRPRLSFHSLRKNMATALDRARVTQADIAAILGHDRGFTLSVYAPLGLELSALQSIIEKARFEPLKLDHLHV